MQIKLFFLRHGGATFLDNSLFVRQESFPLANKQTSHSELVEIIYCAFLGFCFGIFDSNMQPGWGNLVAIDWNDLPVGREFYCKFLKKVKSPPHRFYIDKCINVYVNHTLQCKHSNVYARCLEASK